MLETEKTDDVAFEGLQSLPARRSLGQGVYERLKQAIVQGDFDPGSRVVESRLAAALGRDF